MKAGTPEMKAHMARLRGMRKIKGGNVFDDNKNGFNRTFNPKLGREIKKALTSPEAKQIYSGIAAAGATALTGNPLAGAVAGEAVSTLSGSGLKQRRYRKKNLLVVGGSLAGGVPQVQLNHFGKVTKVGAGFRSATGLSTGAVLNHPLQEVVLFRLETL